MATLDNATDTPYPGSDAKVNAWYSATYRGVPKRNLAGRFAVSADDVASVFARAAGSSRPRARYRVGFLAKMLIAVRRFAPDPVFDAFVRVQFPVP